VHVGIDDQAAAEELARELLGPHRREPELRVGGDDRPGERRLDRGAVAAYVDDREAARAAEQRDRAARDQRRRHVEDDRPVAVVEGRDRLRFQVEAVHRVDARPQRHAGA
jgi:hypothetical protein